MFAVPCVSLLEFLRRRRRRLCAFLLAALAIGLTVALAECLLSAAATPSAAADTAMGGMHSQPVETDTVPCANCTMGSDAASLDDMATVPATPKPLSLPALLVVAVLLLVAPLKTVPIPPQPLLPKRPRTLKFYALRI